MLSRVSLLVLCLSWSVLYGQLNVQFVGNLDYEPILNDIWGYADTSGREYALVGLTSGLSIVSLEDPANPQEIQFIPGVSSTWRDIKTWDGFAYCIADQGQQGLLIVDLTTLPEDTAAWAFWRPDIPEIGVLNKSHNLWIDEYGLLYLAGANIGGTCIVDVKNDPWNPDFLVKMPLVYAHDVYARDSIVYTSEIYLGELHVYDIHDLSDIRPLGSVRTPSEFTHNAWLSDDGSAIFTTDERSNAFVASYDLSDLANIKELDRFRPAATVGLNVIPHNVHVWNDFLIVSYYTDGCIIVDASRPDNLIEVGNFDTYPEAPGGYNGAWGAYPFLPSGNILISDRQHGLFVLSPDYKRGCFLEGMVTDADSHLPVQGAQVEIILEPDDTSEVLLPESTDVTGHFKTGKAVAGTYVIRISHPDYVTKFASGMFENGVVLELNIELQKKAHYSVGGRVVASGSGPSTVPYAYVALQAEGRFYETQADENGMYLLPDVIEGNYELYAGNWGYYQISSLDVNGPLIDDIIVNAAYYDDFLHDLGWTITSTSTGAVWERAVPVQELIFNSFECNPAADLPDDFGNYAYVTGNAGGEAENDGVDGGYTLLSSPFMNLAGYGDPTFDYTPWICQQFVEEQVYFVLVSNGVDTIALDTVTRNSFGGAWEDVSEVHLADHIAITDQMQVHFRVEGKNTGNVIKGALDRVLVYDANPSGVRQIAQDFSPVHVYPNPSSGHIYVSLDSDRQNAERIDILDIYGQIMNSSDVSGPVTTLDISGKVSSGMYLVRIEGEGRVLGIGKVLIQ